MKTLGRIVPAFALVVAFGVTTLPAQAPRSRLDVSRLGPQVGERVPDFKLKDAAGKEWTLQSIMGPKRHAGLLPLR